MFTRSTFVSLCCVLRVISGCSALYFYVDEYGSWSKNVMIYRQSSFSKRNGWLQLTPYSARSLGRGLYKDPIQIQDPLTNSVFSFNTSFVFSMSTVHTDNLYGDGIAFFICPSRFTEDRYQVSSGGYLGMFNDSTNGAAGSQIFAVELDTHYNSGFKDPNDNHVGVDVNSVISLKAVDLYPFGILINDGRKYTCWIDYDGGSRYLWVYLAFKTAIKPSTPVIAMNLDLAPYLGDYAYVGFTSSTGTRAEVHTVYSWWFLCGFGNLVVPTLPDPMSTLHVLGSKSVVAAVFTLAVVLGFLSIFYVLARRRFLDKARHLIDIFLPVACWMYWKEITADELRFKVAERTTELFAWLWRTRLRRMQCKPREDTWDWRLMLMGSNMGPPQRGEGQPEENIQVLHKATHKELGNKAGPEQRVKAVKKKNRSSPQKHNPVTPTPLLVSTEDYGLGIQGKVFDPRLKDFKISSASFILVDEESDEQFADVAVVTSSKELSQSKESGAKTPGDATVESEASGSNSTFSETQTIPTKSVNSPDNADKSDRTQATQSWIFE
ncbi:hypothetical protein KP509_07G058100 [Ceratopteris richardii]|uniref:Legume lectin domain-containing protein n=1 Tax=Ceratopteris richardii TaxID=49495 RepID=A0A8T2UHB7_CERRI|nr:hypothetical protein KP509_07G058100 [Ceratopteris richardii]KAH7433184.1 hypothetical protein KP509_07G058100 [Ceratopteris richardii]